MPDTLLECIEKRDFRAYRERNLEIVIQAVTQILIARDVDAHQLCQMLEMRDKTIEVIDRDVQFLRMIESALEGTDELIGSLEILKVLLSRIRIANRT